MPRFGPKHTAPRAPLPPIDLTSHAIPTHPTSTFSGPNSLSPTAYRFSAAPPPAMSNTSSSSDFDAASTMNGISSPSIYTRNTEDPKNIYDRRSSSYSVPRSPVSTTTNGSCSYVFRQIGFNTMELCADDGTPVYLITVWLNCFNPTSYITTIKSLQSPEQEREVGSFEMGLSRGQSTVTFDNITRPMHDMFYDFRTKVKVAPELGERWVWNRPLVPQLEWDCRTPDQATCYLNNSGSAQKRLAVLTFPSMLTGQTSGERLHRLQISSTGRQYFDDIVVSALIVERKRMTPLEGKTKHHIFN
ncbi:hypothetical protein NLI96_g10667 [Meripilus lineatus]|uniref:DUF6593 domain-containing protein n=1 Tax=Meripilus lineatus TaxID=2056292 RepID=A0AAD5YE06_9APHY|nr:hypothetical protein NLI96_g10667 [Physisporinus lineatus]